MRRAPRPDSATWPFRRVAPRDRHRRSCAGRRFSAGGVPRVLYLVVRRGRAWQFRGAACAVCVHWRRGQRTMAVVTFGALSRPTAFHAASRLGTQLQHIRQALAHAPYWPPCTPRSVPRPYHRSVDSRFRQQLPEANLCSPLWPHSSSLLTPLSASAPAPPSACQQRRT